MKLFNFIIIIDDIKIVPFCLSMDGYIKLSINIVLTV